VEEMKESKAKAAEIKKSTDSQKKDEPAKGGQIDSSAKPPKDDTEIQKAATAPIEPVEEPAEGSEFTPKEMSKIQDDAFEIMEKELEVTFNKIINKAGFLVKLNIPQGFK